MPDIYQQTSMEDVILTVFAVVVILVLWGCLYSFIRAVFLFIFSGGKEEKKKKGRNAIRFMIIGAILTIVLLVSFPYILKGMNVELTDQYSTKKVFTRAGELFKKLFEVGQMIKQGQKENEFRGNMYINTSPSTSTTTSPYNL